MIKEVEIVIAFGEAMPGLFRFRRSKT